MSSAGDEEDGATAAWTVDDYRDWIQSNAYSLAGLGTAVASGFWALALGRSLDNAFIILSTLGLTPHRGAGRCVPPPRTRLGPRASPQQLVNGSHTEDREVLERHLVQQGNELP